MMNEKSTVASRQIIHDGIELGTVIEIAVSKKAKRHTFPGGVEGENSYLHFMYNTKGGLINLHVRSSDELQGQTIRAHFQVVKKVMSDGREFVYIDLFPTDAPVTHWWQIFGSDKETCVDWLSFENDDGVTIAFPLLGDKRAPKSRSVIAYSDESVTTSSPFAVLAEPK